MCSYAVDSEEGYPMCLIAIANEILNKRSFKTDNFLSLHKILAISLPQISIFTLGAVAIQCNFLEQGTSWQFLRAWKGQIP